jgi:protein tyrosine phosphatase (PTP) superfamily phosphohydrolase (DUF442 family)
MRNFVLLAGLVFATAIGNAMQAPGTSSNQTRPEADAKLELSGLHNVFRIMDKLLSGSAPEEDAGFQSLQRLGIKTIISVDGARPDLERAHKFGMRYVHIPVGYDGVPREAALRMAKAARDLPGPIYIHCHHGQHRGPASAAVVHLLLEPSCTVDQALAEMKRAGTDPKYKGLYAAPGDIRRGAAANLDAVTTDFLEAIKPAGLQESMVHVDEQWDKLKLIQAAAWHPPKGHPDISPAHEALMLVEQFREAARLPEVQKRPEDFRKWLDEALKNAEKLEAVLTSKKDGGPDTSAAEMAFRATGATCARCHSKYRDVPPEKRAR